MGRNNVRPQREWSVGQVVGEITEITQDSEAGQLL